MNTTPQRENWDGHPVDCGDAWVLRKGDKVARPDTHEAWKKAMLEKGWT